MEERPHMERWSKIFLRYKLDETKTGRKKSTAWDVTISGRGTMLSWFEKPTTTLPQCIWDEFPPLDKKTAHHKFKSILEAPRAAKKATEHKAAHKFKKTVEQQWQAADVESVMLDFCGLASLDRQTNRMSYKTVDHAKEHAEHTAKHRQTPIIQWRCPFSTRSENTGRRCDQFHTVGKTTQYWGAVVFPQEKTTWLPKSAVFGCNMKVPVQPSSSESGTNSTPMKSS